ncbi:MAG: GNAT family N-acetyltransferase [Anaerolineae bacterium]|nr:GNAT family N-acetyltransferase [Anaerolineae bacterium]
MEAQDQLKPPAARPHIILRTATRQDIDALITFIEPHVESGALLRRTYDEVEEWLPNFYLAEVDGEIVGCAALEIYSRKLAEIRSLAVSPTMQGMGIGKMLVNACVELARQKYILEVMVITSNEQFFKAVGFDFTMTGEKKALFIQTREKY